MLCDCRPLTSGLGHISLPTQGVAPGYNILPFQGLLQLINSHHCSGAKQQYNKELFLPGSAAITRRFILPNSISLDGVTKIYSIVKIKFDGNTGSVNVYPNPIKDKINVDLGGIIEKAEVQLINMAGQTFFTNTYKNVARLTIEIPLTPGIYVMKINANDKVSTLPIIKQ